MLAVRKLVAIAMTAVAAAGCSVTPEPYEREAVMGFVKEDKNLIHAGQEPLTGPLTLSETMARALKYNLENRVQLVQEALASRSFELIKLDMLPLLTASAGRLSRNNWNASRSMSIITFRESLEPSTSQDKQRTVGDIRFAWNILDFGVSYLQAKQEADRFLITELGRREVMIKLLQQVRGAYWRAAAMQRISNDLERTLDRARTALENLRKVRDEQLRTPLSVLQDLRALVETVQELEQMEQTVNQARVELALMINEPADAELFLSLPDEPPGLPQLPTEMEALEVEALANSAGYVGELYNARIDQLESRKAMARLLPGLEFGYSGNYDSNGFLVNNQWREASLRLTGNILKLLAWKPTKEHNEAREQLSVARRMAMNMAVVTKLHLAWQDYQNAIVRLERATELDAVDRDISQLTEQAVASQAAGELDQIQGEARALRSAMAGMLAYAEAQASFGNLLVSAGFNPVPEAYQTRDVATLADELSTNFAPWERGRFATKAESERNSQLASSTGEKREAPSPSLSSRPRIKDSIGFSAKFEDAIRAYKSGDMETALRELRVIAKNGHAEAPYILGYILSSGEGVPPDLKEAAEWFQLGARSGDPDAQFNIAAMYQNGRGVELSLTKAAEWYRQAAEQGHAGAQAKLGAMYALGTGVKVDDDEALRWLRLSAEQGDAAGQYNLGLMYSQGRGVPTDGIEATKWFRKAAEQGHVGAQDRIRASEAAGLLETDQWEQFSKQTAHTLAGTGNGENQRPIW